MRSPDSPPGDTTPSVEHTLPTRQRDFREWHLGRPVFSVWAIALENAVLEERLGRVRDALDGMLLRGYARQPHITLQVCGFPATAAGRSEDFTLGELRAQIRAPACSGIAAFDVHIAEPFTFTAAACLAVQDATGSLARIRSSWERVASTWDKTPYVPHVTAGLYAVARPLAEVQARLKSIPPAPTLALRVRSLEWMCYESTRIAGPLRTLLRFDLDRRISHVIDAPGWQRLFGEARGSLERTSPT